MAGDSPNSKTPPLFKIWHWNFRSIRRKREALIQLVINEEHPPDLILLQDPKTSISLPDYIAYHSPNDSAPVVSTFTKRVIRHTQRNFPHIVQNVVLEVIPIDIRQDSLLIANIYSPPSMPATRCAQLIAQITAAANKTPLIVAGDFNCAHIDWGYKKTTGRGEVVMTQTQQSQLTVFNDFDCPTRQGTTGMMDTSPDLTMGRRIQNLEWNRTTHTLGSDHYIIEVKLSGPQASRARTKHKLINWDNFRKQRERNQQTGPMDAHTWTAQVLEDQAACTKEYIPEHQVPVMDSKLAHLIEAHESLMKRYAHQKRNRKLQSKISGLSTQIHEYSQQLCRQNWQQICENLRGNLTTTRTWHLLKHLLDPMKSKHHNRNLVARLTHDHKYDTEALLQKLKTLHTSPGTPIPLPDFAGLPNSELDRDITIEEVRAALHRLRNTTPGEDRITNAALRNLDDNSLRDLTDIFNTHWRSGTLPEEWTHGRVILIPKPNKPVTAENMRPI